MHTLFHSTKFKVRAYSNSRTTDSLESFSYIIAKSLHAMRNITRVNKNNGIKGTEADVIPSFLYVLFRISRKFCILNRNFFHSYRLRNYRIAQSSSPPSVLSSSTLSAQRKSLSTSIAIYWYSTVITGMKIPMVPLTSQTSTI